MKLLITQPGEPIDEAIWTGPSFPNASYPPSSSSAGLCFFLSLSLSLSLSHDVSLPLSHSVSLHASLRLHLRLPLILFLRLQLCACVAGKLSTRINSSNFGD